MDDWASKCNQIKDECKHLSDLLGLSLPSGLELWEAPLLPGCVDKYKDLLCYHQQLQKNYENNCNRARSVLGSILPYRALLGDGFFPRDVLVLFDPPPGYLWPASLALIQSLREHWSRAYDYTNKLRFDLKQQLAAVVELYGALGLPLPMPPTSPSATIGADHMSILATFVAEHNGVADTVTRERPMFGVSMVSPTSDVMMWADGLLATLSETKRKNEDEIAGFTEELKVLFQRLGWGNDELDEFVKSHSKHSCASVVEYTEQVNRTRTSYVAKLQEQIATLVQSVATHEESLYRSESEKRGAPSLPQEYAALEHLLTELEHVQGELASELRSKEQLLSLVEQFLEVREIQRGFADQDSNRHSTIGFRERAIEEDNRNKVARYRPELLQTAIQSWESAHDRHFMVRGMRFLRDVETFVHRPQRVPSATARPLRDTSNTMAGKRKMMPSNKAEGSAPKRQKADERPATGTSTGVRTRSMKTTVTTQSRGSTTVPISRGPGRKR